MKGEFELHNGIAVTFTVESVILKLSRATLFIRQLFSSVVEPLIGSINGIIYAISVLITAMAVVIHSPRADISEFHFQQLCGFYEVCPVV